VIELDDLDPELRTIILELGRHPKVVVGCGSKAVILYVRDRQTKKLVESKIPEEYLAQILVVLTGRIRPARQAYTKAHEPAPKDPAKRRKARG
jgi:hypothetical protein